MRFILSLSLQFQRTLFFIIIRILHNFSEILTPVYIPSPITLICNWIKNKSSVTTCFKMSTTNTSAETLWAISFRIESISMITRNSITDRWCGCSDVMFNAIFIIFVTDWTITTFDSFWPITLIIRWSIQQLFPVY